MFSYTTKMISASALLPLIPGLALLRLLLKAACPSSSGHH